MPNLNYPDYGMGFGGYGQAAAPVSPAQQAPGLMSSILPYVNPIAGVVGTVSNAYGSYLQSQQAEKQYEEAVRQFNEEKARRDRMDVEARQQQALQNSLSTGQYAANRSADIQTPYVGYARALGR